MGSTRRVSRFLGLSLVLDVKSDDQIGTANAWQCHWRTRAWVISGDQGLRRKAAQYVSLVSAKQREREKRGGVRLEE